MPRDTDWMREIRDARRKENWTLRGSNRVIKVTPLTDPRRHEVRGFVTVARSLGGKGPAAIESALGLPEDSLKAGARIYNLARIPQPSEVEYELTAKFPDGLAYSPWFGDQRYGPGSDKIHQWRLRDGVSISVVSDIELMPGQRFIN